MAKADKSVRLSKLAREFNVGVSTLVDMLSKKGYEVDSNPNTKVDGELYDILAAELGSDISLKKESQKVSLQNLRDKKESISLEETEEPVTDKAEGKEPVVPEQEEEVKTTAPEKEVFQVEKPKVNLVVKGKIDIEDKKKEKKEETPKAEKIEKEKTPKAAPKAKAKKEPAQEKPKAPEKKVEHIKAKAEKLPEPKVVGQIDLKKEEAPKTPKAKATETKKPEEPKKKTASKAVKKDEVKKETPTPEKAPKKEEVKVYRHNVERLAGPTVVGKIDLPTVETRKKESGADSEAGKGKRKKRKRIKKDNQRVPVSGQQGRAPQSDKQAAERGQAKKRPPRKRPVRQEVSEEEVQKQIKETLARLTSKGGRSRGARYRREKRDLASARIQQEMEQEIKDLQTLKVTEFVSANELANMMDVDVTEVIDVCMNLGLMVSINQRLDAETMALVADEFGYKVEFISADLQDVLEEEADNPEDLKPRAPIVTVMGHVDHGKTSLLDKIRDSNVIAGEAGGITQHIGAYSVEIAGGKRITFLDTPGHEAFTAMRARGARVTDVAIIVVAADDNVMPQTVEAINHASAAGVPIVFAINKIDKPTANPEKIKEALANMNYLVEEWGGKYQSQDVSAKSGLNVDKLLEKVLLEAELLELKANPNKKATGTIIESSLDKGRGYSATVLVEAGTLKQGDIMLAGTHFGRVKAMFNERGKRIDSVGPASPVQLIGLNGAPLAGDYFNVMDTDKEAKDIATRREQLQRIQGLRAQKHITLDEIGRRIAIGNFQELNIVVKGDVDGSVEALSDSLIKLSTEQIQVNVIHKAVGQISESDILLAAASNAVVIGFQVRPSIGARRLAEQEEIDIRKYSIIYDAIDEVKSAMEGMLSPEIKEEILGTAEILEIFKVSKVGSVAGCIVREGKILRNAKVRLIRDGIVIYTGDLGSLKRFKDDVREVANGFECGLNINNFNDIKVGDLVESFQEVEVKRTL